MFVPLYSSLSDRVRPYPKKKKEKKRKEKKMWHIYTMEYYETIKKKKIICPRNPNTGTENQTPHVLTHKWELKKESTWTKGGPHHKPGLVEGWEARGGIALGEIPNVSDELMGAASQHGTCIPVYQTCTLCSCTLELKV